MMSRVECVARAVELEAKMADATTQEAHDEYAQLAAQWRILADIAAHEEQSRATVQ
jgi:hypothetical protein